MNPEASRRPWLPFAMIIAASALAHLWCLGSQFYMDDGINIVNNDAIRTGWHLEFSSLSWTHLWYHLQYRLFGISSVGFHAFNWLMHTANACLLFAFARDFIAKKWPTGIALAAALWFAVHPLNSEIPNYARTQDLAWVTMFTLFGAWAMLRFLQDGQWWKLIACIACLAGGTMSKGPGIIHVTLVTGTIAFIGLLSKDTRTKAWQALAITVASAALAIWLGGLGGRVQALGGFWDGPEFLKHALTLSRVFWEFAWRAVIPVHLSADHQIAETVVVPHASIWALRDKIALLSAAGLLALTGCGFALMCRERSRVIGACVFLFGGTILFRLAYPLPEYMPEYRIYPAMPWFCLGGAIAVAWLWKRCLNNVSPQVPGMVFLLVLAGMSAARSFQWHDLDVLMKDVLKQYPAQIRSLWILQERDRMAGKWEVVIDRHEKLFAPIKDAFLTELRRDQSVRELPTGHFALAEVGTTGEYAIALAHAKGAATGLRAIGQLEALMHALQIDPKTNHVHWAYFNRDKGLILEIAGRYEEAAFFLRKAGVNGNRQKELDRVEEKLAAQRAGTLAAPPH